MPKRPPLKCILSVGLALCLTACHQPPQPSGSSSVPTPDISAPPVQTGQLLTVPVYAERSFHPVLASDRLNLTVAPLLYEPLFRLDASFTPQPVLCQSSSVSQDGLTWTFTLWPGITFSDGTPLTAQLTAAALNLARTGSSHYAGRFSGIASIAALSERQLTITLIRPNTGLPALLDIPIALGESDRPLGTGPYVLTDGTLTARSDWWQGSSLPTGEIRLFPITRTEQLSAGFEDGSFSLVSTDPTATDAPGFSGVYDRVDYDTTTLVFLGFHTGKSALRTAQARVALAAALDRSALVSAAWSGHASAAALPIHPASFLYDESLARQLSDSEEAVQLLEDAGLSGQVLTLVVNRENASKVTAAQLIARQLKKAGLEIVVSSLSWNDYLNTLADGRFDLYLGELTLTADFDLSPLYGSGSSANYSRWYSVQADRLIRALLSAPAEGQQAAAVELCSYLTQEMPLTPLCFKRGSVLTRWGSIRNLTPTRGNVFSGMDRWIVH